MFWRHSRFIVTKHVQKGWCYHRDNSCFPLGPTSITFSWIVKFSTLSKVSTQLDTSISLVCCRHSLKRSNPGFDQWPAGEKRVWCRKSDCALVCTTSPSKGQYWLGRFGDGNSKIDTSTDAWCVARYTTFMFPKLVWWDFGIYPSCRSWQWCVATYTTFMFPKLVWPDFGIHPNCKSW